MNLIARDFPKNARAALLDTHLQEALIRLKSGFVEGRRAAISRLPEFDDLRDRARDIRRHTLAHLDAYLERFEAKAVSAGGIVHWARNADEARHIILEICQGVDAKTVTKGKSMIGEEIAINAYLEDHGIEPVETDLGEYIIQLRGEAPSHIIAPATHLAKEQVADAFRAKHTQLDAERPLEKPEQLLAEARAQLRQKFLSADVGITGANFLIAETGTSVIVTNEGNGDLTQILPGVHIVIASLEKVVPTLEDAATLLRVLARSATGQDISAYTTFSTGPKRAADLDGPGAYHVVILDNGRSQLLAGENKDMLGCIRCGACLNHCPVYGAIGGHAYGSVYPGPMGSVLTPALEGISGTAHLPQASSLCGKCEEVCPVRLALPRMLRNLRNQAAEAGATGLLGRIAIKYWAFWARRPRLYRAAVDIKFSALAALGRKKGYFRRVPFMGAWTKHRDFPAPEGRSFISQYHARKKT
ncbi:MAG: iron-sulfur cluster-binding protein [Rhodospirillales bacterium]|nr:iron-sulfur cluster-binding protein [Rhodospirillales bacterium]